MTLVCKKVEPVPIEERDFLRGESRREARKIESRAVSLSGALLAYLKVKRRRLIRDMIKEIRKTGKISEVRKASSSERQRLIKILSYYGLKQIDDSGRELMGSEWSVPDPFIADYLASKKKMINGLDSRIEKEFQSAVGKALFKWMQEKPAPDMEVIARRLQRLLEVKSQKEAPKDLKAMGDRFTENGLLARSRMIARTEINAARNYGRVEAGKALGRTHLVWLANDDGRSGQRHHEALNGQVREIGKPFKNPKTGSELLYPGDPEASARFKRGGKVLRSKFGAAGEIINCRCSVRPISAQVAARLRGRK